MTPEVSVILAVFNGIQYLPAAIQSILNQTGIALELIVVDDGSTDATPQYLRSVEDPRLKVIHQSNLGQTKALNLGMQHAQAPLLARMDADDLCHPQRLSIQRDFFSAHPEHVLLGTDALFINAAGDAVGHSFQVPSDAWIRCMLPVANPCVHGSLMFRRQAIEQVGGYDETIRYAQDYDLVIRLAQTGQIANLPQTLYSFRQHAGSISQAKRSQQEQYVAEIQANYWKTWLNHIPQPTLQSSEKLPEYRPEHLHTWARYLVQTGLCLLFKEYIHESLLYLRHAHQAHPQRWVYHLLTRTVQLSPMIATAILTPICWRRPLYRRLGFSE